MKQFVTRVAACTAAVPMVLMLTSTAHAYIDPGAGSMFLQAVIAGIAACSVSIGVFWKRLRSFFKGTSVKDGAHKDDNAGK